MSLSRPKRRIVLAGLLATAGCGFSPAFAPGGSAGRLVGQIAVAEPDNRDAYELTKQLELRLGRATAARYELAYGLRISRDGVGLTTKNETTRFDLVGTVNYRVTELGQKTPVATGKVRNFTSYSVGTVDTTVSPPSTSSTISTRAAEIDARSRLMVILADQIVTQLVATSGSWAE